MLIVDASIIRYTNQFSLRFLIHNEAVLIHILKLLQPYLMGVMVPDEEVLVPWAKQNGISGSFKQICTRQVSIYDNF